MVSQIKVKTSTVSVFVDQVSNILTIKTKVNTVSYKINKKMLNKKEYFSSLHTLYLLTQNYGKRCETPKNLPLSPIAIF